VLIPNLETMQSPLFAVASALATPLVTYLALRERVTRLERKVDALLALIVEKESANLSPAAKAMLERVMGLPSRRWSDPT
jgi:hypothetical protein